MSHLQDIRINTLASRDAGALQSKPAATVDGTSSRSPADAAPPLAAAAQADNHDPSSCSCELRQVQEVLEAALCCYEHPQQQAAAVHRCQDAESHLQDGCEPLADLVQLLLNARAAGLPGIDQAAARLVAAPGVAVALSSSSTCSTCVAALVCLLAGFNSEALNSAVVRQVQWLAVEPRQAQTCALLVAGLGGFPDVQRQAALAAAEALQAAASQGVLGGQVVPGAASMWIRWRLLMDAVWDQPPVQLQLVLAAVEALLGDAGAAVAQKLPGQVVALSDLLLGSPGLSPGHYEQLTAACTKHPDGVVLLQQLLRSKAVQARPDLRQQLELASVDALLASSDAAFAQRQPAELLAMSDLLLGNPSLTSSHYGRFAAACTKRQDSLELLLLLLRSEAVQPQPAVGQQLALAAADALFAGGDTAFAQQQPATLLEMADLLLSSSSLSTSHYGRFVIACTKRSDCQELLLQILSWPSVRAYPPLQQQLTSVAANALLAGGEALFAQQQPESLLAMSDLLLSSPALISSHYGRFAAACLKRQDCQELLQQLLQSPLVEAASALPAVQPLVASRWEFLQGQVEAISTCMWCMPEACLPGYPQVEAFLRGPEQQAAFEQMFTSAAQARDWTWKYFNGRQGAVTAAYSAMAWEGGRGKDVFCTVVKTRCWHDRDVQAARNTLLAELQAVTAKCACPQHTDAIPALH